MRQANKALTKSEREVILTVADDETAWTVYSDSRRYSGQLLRLAARWGVEPIKFGRGFEVCLPLRAIRFAGPRVKRTLSTEERERRGQRLRAIRQKPNPGAVSSKDTSEVGIGGGEP